VSSPLSPSPHGRASSWPTVVPLVQCSSDIVAAPTHSATSGLGWSNRRCCRHGPPRAESQRWICRSRRRGKKSN
jgi:hypothetical protein